MGREHTLTQPLGRLRPRGQAGVLRVSLVKRLVGAGEERLGQVGSDGQELVN